jgi:hypothetical protein
MSETAVIAKVEELMKALDQVKRYKSLARLMVDFLMIILLSFVALFSLELIFNFYYLIDSFPSYFSYPNIFSIATISPGITVSNNLPALLIMGAGIVLGIFWVDHKLKRVKLEEWRNTLNDGFAGALELLQGLNWDVVFDDIRASKIAYAFHAFVKVAGYWIVTMIILFVPYEFGLSLIHTDANFYLLAFIASVLVLFLSRKDLQKKYRQVTSLDQLLWELRWFNSEFKSAEFQT